MIHLNHTIVFAKNARESAHFLTELFGLEDPQPWGKFLAVKLANGVTLDYLDFGKEFPGQHYAFQVSEEEFDEIFARIKERNITYYADPFAQKPGEINTHDGGRGLYFPDPNGHYMEIITRPYGGGPALPR